MRSLSLYVQWLWAGSVLTQLFVLFFLLMKASFRKLPFFTAYVVLNICQAGFLAVVYYLWGIDSATPKMLAWYSEYVTLLAQALATGEILSVTLKPYRGIWGLGWRALIITSTLVLICVAMAARGQSGSALWFELNRGYHLTFASALIACLLLVRYYSIPVPVAYKMILGGFCFYSCTEILVNTILQALLKKSFYAYQPIWQFSSTFSFVLVQVVWAVALRKPLPVEDRQTAAVSDSDYQRLSPEINEHLRLLNEKLARLWKLEARSQ